MVANGTMSDPAAILAQKGDLAVQAPTALCDYAHLVTWPDCTPVRLRPDYYSGAFYREPAAAAWLEKTIREEGMGLWDTFYLVHNRLFRRDELVVDIGAGTGYFVAFRSKLGSPAAGIEPDLTAVAWARELIKPDWEELGEIPVPCSARLCLVLEHIEHPVSFLQDIVRRCKGGRVLVQVPNEFNPLQQRINRGPHKDWFVAPWHLNYFTPESLKRLMAKVGLKVVDVGATFPMELFVLAGFDYRSRPELGARLHLLRLNFEKLAGPSAYRLYRLLFTRLNWGREFYLLAEPQKGAS